MNKKGKIISEGKYHNWIVEMSTDFQDTGGVYLFLYNRDNGYDYWFSTVKEAYRTIEEENLEIIWEEDKF